MMFTLITLLDIDFLKAENERLFNIIRLLKRDRFGSRSEKVIDIPNQFTFNEIEIEASQLLPPETEKITYIRKKGKGKKKAYPDNLPREERIIDLKDEEKFCPHDHTSLKQIGEERKEKLKTIPAQMSIVVEIVKKYACPACESYMVQPKVNAILPGTIATPELLSFIIFSKFFQSLPLYRLEELFSLKGIYLSRGTMARWMVKLTQYNASTDLSALLNKLPKEMQIANKAYFQDLKVRYGSVRLPQIMLKDSNFVFDLNGRNATLQVVDLSKGLFKLNGEELKINPKTPPEVAIENITNLLKQKKNAHFSISLMPQAQAVVQIIVAIALAAMVFFLVQLMAFTYELLDLHFIEKKLKEYALECKKASNKIDTSNVSQKPYLTPKDLNDLLDKITALEGMQENVCNQDSFRKRDTDRTDDCNSLKNDLLPCLREAADKEKQALAAEKPGNNPTIH